MTIFGTIGKMLVHLFVDFIPSLAASTVRNVVTKQGEATVEKILKDERAELEADLRHIEPAKKQNLRRWLREARAKNLENKLVTLWLKIKKDGTGTRSLALEQLDGFSDEEFQEHMELLDHDVIPQTARRWAESIRLGASNATKETDQAVAGEIRELNQWLARKLPSRNHITKKEWIIAAAVVAALITLFALQT